MIRRRALPTIAAAGWALGAVLAQLGAVGDDGGCAGQADAGQVFCFQPAGTGIGAPRQQTGCPGCYVLLRRGFQVFIKSGLAVGDDGFEHGAGGPGNAK